MALDSFVAELNGRFESLWDAVRKLDIPADFVKQVDARLDSLAVGITQLEVPALRSWIGDEVNRLDKRIGTVADSITAIEKQLSGYDFPRFKSETEGEIEQLTARATELERLVKMIVNRQSLSLENTKRGIGVVKWDGSGLESIPAIVRHGLGAKPKIVLANGTGGNFSALAYVNDVSAWTDEEFQCTLLAAKAIPHGGVQQNFSWLAVA